MRLHVQRTLPIHFKFSKRMSQKGLTPRLTPISSEKSGELLLDLVVEGSDPLVLRHLLNFSRKCAHPIILLV
jgi:hypothetical protein